MGICLSSDEDKRTAGVEKSLKNQAKQEARVKKLLLLGAGGSGKSTFFKQLRNIHGTGIQQHELEHTYKEIVFSNIISGMKTLIEKSEELTETEPECAVLPDHTDYANFISAFDEDNFTAQRDEVSNAIQALWGDKGIQATWAQRSRFQIQDSAEYFFNNIVRVTQADYLPSHEDVLLARIRTTGIVEQEFEIKGNKFQVFDVGGQRNERKKWIHCFERVTGVIFLAALSAYDQTLYEDDQTNRMREALDLFKQICNSRWFKDAAMILFLNKKDLFEIKIKKVPISICFPEYQGLPHDEIEARDYIKGQFAAQNQVVKKQNRKKQLFVHFTCAIDRNQVEKIFRDVQHIIIQANLERAALI